MLILVPTIVLAEDTSYNVIQKVAQTVLNVISWFGLAIALGMLIWIGIKYVLSGASEKANLKGTMRNYVIGVALILTCTTIASAIASVISSTGDNTAGGIIGKGFQLGGLKVGERTMAGDDENDGVIEIEMTEEYREDRQELIDEFNDMEAETNQKEKWTKSEYKGGNILAYTQNGETLTYSDDAGSEPVVSAPAEINGKVFKYWMVKRTDKGSSEPVVYTSNNPEFVAQGSDPTFFWEKPDSTYEIYAFYEDAE